MTETSTDRVVRAMTRDGAFRVVAAVTSHTVHDATSIQRASGELAQRLGELITGAILVRETMAPGRRVQVILQDATGGRLVADSRPDGTNRGIVNPGKDAPVDTRSEALIQVNYTLANGNLHQGVVSVPADESISTALMRYMQTSEQVVSIIAVGSHHSEGNGRAAAVAGFVVQLLPEAEHETLAAMTEHLSSYNGLEELLQAAEPDPDALIAGILHGQDYARLAESGLCFGCNCSKERMLIGIGTLPRAEIVELIEGGEALECSCDACGQRYEIGLDELGALLVADDPTSGSGAGGMEN